MQLLGGALGIGLLFFIPGLGLSYAISPRGLRGDLRLALAPAASIATTGLLSTALAAAHQLAALQVIVGSSILTVVFVVVGLARGARPLGIRTPPFAELVLAVALVVALGAVTYAGTRSAIQSAIPAATTTWYYIGLAHQMAREGGIPADSPEWGRRRPYQVDYVLATSHLAAYELVTDTVGRSDRLYRLAWIGALWASLWLVARTFATRWSTAVVTLVLAGASTWLLWKFASYRPENVAFVMVLAAAFCLGRGLRHPDRRGWLVLSGILSVGVFLAHAEMFAMLGVAAVATSASWLAISGLSARAIRRAISGVFVIGLGGIAAYVALSAAAGEPRWFPTGDAGTLAGHGPDPTWELYRLITGQPEGTPAPGSPFDPYVLQPLVVRPLLGLWLSSPLGGFVGGVLVAGAVALLPRLHRRDRAQLAFGVAFSLLVLAGSLIVWYAAETYIPGRVGPLRLLGFAWVGILVAVAAFTRPALRQLAGRPAPGTSGRPAAGGRRLAFARAVVSCGTALLVLAASLLQAPPIPVSQASPQGVRALEWVDRHAEPGSRLLLNGYTDGIVGALTRLNGVLDGRATYLENPAWMRETFAVLGSARDFFSGEPSSILDQYDVDYLLVATDEPRGLGITGATFRISRREMNALAERYGLLPVRDFRFGGLQLYRVP